MTDLTDPEIDNICDGYIQNAARVRYLRSLGLTVRQKPNGRPLVNRAHYDAMIHPVAPEPDVSAHMKPIDRELNQGLQDWQAGRRAVGAAIQAKAKAWLMSPAYARLKSAMAAEAIDRHASIVRHHSAQRRAARVRQCPAWADHEKIKAIYRHAQNLTKATGIEHHVDHIVPLAGRHVRGLHVHNNMQVIPATENLRKHNHYEVEQ